MLWVKPEHFLWGKVEMADQVRHDTAVRCSIRSSMTKNLSNVIARSRRRRSNLQRYCRPYMSMRMGTIGTECLQSDKTIEANLSPP